MASRTERIQFEGSQNAGLAARLDLPEGEPRAYALFAHCFTCSKDVFAAARISAGLAERGFAVLRFDFTGLGASDGDFANTNFSSNVEDLIRAADWLRDNRRAPDLLVGHSLGGAAVLAAAKSRKPKPSPRSARRPIRPMSRTISRPISAGSKRKGQRRSGWPDAPSRSAGNSWRISKASAWRSGSDP